MEMIKTLGEEMRNFLKEVEEKTKKYQSNFIGMIKTLGEEMRNFLKEVEEKTKKILEEINKSLKEAQKGEKTIKQVKEITQTGEGDNSNR